MLNGTTAKRNNTVSKCSFFPISEAYLVFEPTRVRSADPSAVVFENRAFRGFRLASHVCLCFSFGFRVLPRALVSLTLSLCLFSCCLFAKIVPGQLWYKQMCQSDTRVGHHVARLVDSITCPGFPDNNLNTGVDLLTPES